MSALLPLLFASALAAAAPAPTAVRIETRDFTLDMPAHIPAGLIDFTLENKGSEAHEVRFVRITGKHTFDDFVAWQKTGKPIPEWLEPSGGIAPVAPGLHQEYLLSLNAGSYVALCTYLSDDGKTDTEKGMYRALEIDKGGPAAARPDADITITLSDHHFQLTAPFEGPRPMIHLRNVGSEPHQAQLVKLPDETSPYSERAWFDHGGRGPRPGTPVGGSVDVPTGGEAWFRVDLPKGKYVLLCAQAEEEGRHYELGMVYTFEVE
jgi:hypothetical protein